MNPTKFKARNGETMFAWNPKTDPLGVVIELAWAWADGQAICSMNSCPTLEGGYCLECHGVAYSAQEYARARMTAIDLARKARQKEVADRRAEAEHWIDTY